MDKNEVAISYLKSLFSNVPVAGQLLNEVFFEYRSRVRQNRLNSFIELLENFFSNHQGINLENFQTEEFSDLFESIIKKVILTKSLFKLELFRNILTKQLYNSLQNVDDSEIYLELVSSLNELEIRILYDYWKYNKNLSPENDIFKELNRKLEILRKETNSSNDKYIGDLEELKIKCEFQRTKLVEINTRFREVWKPEYYNISMEQFIVYKQRLFSKGLFKDFSLAPPQKGGGGIDQIEITQFGKRFINYILDE